MNKYIAFTANINGEEVRITCDISTVDVVSRDNEITYGESLYDKLQNIEFESIYED